MGNWIISALTKAWKFTKDWAVVVLLFIALVSLIYWTIHGMYSADLLVRFESYLRIISISLVVVAFALLRLYNSQVANTRFIVKLREAIRKLELAMVPFERNLKTSSNAMDRNSTHLKGLSSTMDDLGSSIED